MNRLGLPTVLAAAAGLEMAWGGTGLCARPRPGGTVSTMLDARQVCTAGDAQLDPFVLQRPQGLPGLQGAAWT